MYSFSATQGNTHLTNPANRIGREQNVERVQFHPSAARLKRSSSACNNYINMRTGQLISDTDELLARFYFRYCMFSAPVKSVFAFMALYKLAILL